MTLILTLDAADAREPAFAGEKAAALARMRQSGLPVPPGFVVTVTAFDDAFSPITTRIQALLEDNAEDGADLSAASREIEMLVHAIEPSESLRDALQHAYAALSDGEAGAPVAVRSSGTAEDLAGASFAGQYSTFLNVTGREETLDRIRAVWASAYSAHAIAYRNQHSVPHAAARMAVLIQRQIPAGSSGVLFTRNPITGAADRIVINAAYGLGEGVVAGEAAADTFELDSGSLKVVGRTVVTKSGMVASAATGGIEQQPVAEDLRERPALSDDQLAALGQLALDVKRVEGGDRDIEFAVTDSGLYLLQARPLTGLDEQLLEAEFPVVWDSPEDEQYLWTLSAGFTAPAPLTQFAQEVQRASFDHRRRVFEETGAPMARAHIERFFNGYNYVRGPQVDEAAVARRLQAHEALAEDHAGHGRDYYVEEIEPLVRDLLDSFGRFKRPARESLSERVEHLSRALEAGAYAMGDLHWRMAGAGTAKASMTWPATFAEITGESPVEATTFLQSIDHKTTRLVRRLRGMARVVQGDNELRELFAAAAFDRLNDQKIRARPATKLFRSRFRSLLRDYGRRSGRSFGSSVSFATPTWNLNPEAPLALVASYAQQDLGELDRSEADSRCERLRTTRRIRRALSSDPERLASFDLALRRVHDHIRSMENHNFYIEQGVVGVVREAIWWLGQALVRDGRLDHPDHALHLSLDQIRAAADGTADDLRPVAARNMEEFERQSQLHPPPHVGKGDPSTAAGPPGRNQAPESDIGLQGSLLKGQAASRGRHTGRARVFTPGGDMPKVVRGDILVARNAGQDWAPILPLLGGIVLDEGAIFQHAALVAREYRVPCVIQTRDGTTAITDGQIVTIDGDAGTVDLNPVAATE